MPIRHHPITGEPVLFAPERAGRPNAFGQRNGESNVASRESDLPTSDSRDCPFCPGNEHQTPPAIVALGDPWRVRVFPNLYPVVDGHEVIVESHNHDAQTIEDEAVGVWLDRYRAHGGAAYVSLFKNHGAMAGASIPHIHSQLVPLPFVPPRVQRELDGFARAERCPLCAGIGTVVDENASFRAIAPHASSFAYQLWIVPKRHQPELATLTDAEACDLAAMLNGLPKKSEARNWLFMNFPRTGAAHFYIDVVPRLTSIAGFELATGTFIEIIDPAKCFR